MLGNQHRLLLLGSVIGFASAIGLGWHEGGGHLVSDVLQLGETRRLAIVVPKLMQLGLSGMFVSYLWVRCGLTFQSFAISGCEKPGDFFREIQVVLFCQGVGSCVLTGYALLIAGLAGQAVFASRSNSPSNQVASSDPC